MNFIKHVKCCATAGASAVLLSLLSGGLLLLPPQAHATAFATLRRNPPPAEASSSLAFFISARIASLEKTANALDGQTNASFSRQRWSHNPALTGPGLANSATSSINTMIVNLQSLLAEATSTSLTSAETKGITQSVNQDMQSAGLASFQFSMLNTLNSYQVILSALSKKTDVTSLQATLTHLITQTNALASLNSQDVKGITSGLAGLVSSVAALVSANN